MMEFPCHSGKVLEQLNHQRKLGLLCDCTFVVDGVDFKAHKAVLAACSVYFRTLFLDQKDVVHLDISNAAGLGQVLEFMYTAKLSLSPQNIEDVLAVANFLKMQEIVSACSDFQAVENPAVTLITQEFTVEEKRDEEEQRLQSDLTDAASYAEESPPSSSCQDKVSTANQDSLKEHSSSTEVQQTVSDHEPARTQSGRGRTPKNSSISAQKLTVKREEDGAARDVPEFQDDPSDVDYAPKSVYKSVAGSSYMSSRGRRVRKAPQRNFPAENDSEDEGTLKAHTQHVKAETVEMAAGEEEEVMTAMTHEEEEEEDEEEVTEEEYDEVSQQMDMDGDEANAEEVGRQTQTSCMSSRSESKPYSSVTHKCKDCGKKFTHTGNFKRHIRIHTGEKPFSCRDCNKAFSDPAACKAHEKTHSPLKPYCCSTCGKSYRQISLLNLHRKRHTGEARYSCDVCFKLFTTSGNLKRHQLVHSGEKPYQCNYCDKSFSDPTAKMRHLETHDTEKGNKCPHCDKRFNQVKQTKSIKHSKTSVLRLKRKWNMNILYQ
ncbi:hypothetical protein LDENG_00143720 [Lucifuga dentata]|nr:hypothetical protein LDENG_00143720 [Lucifuga dentata]